MDQLERARRLKEMLTQVAPGDTVESLPKSTWTPPAATESVESFGLESIGGDEATETTVARALEKIDSNREADLTETEVSVLEAIVMPQNRPVVFARGTSYDDVPDPWLHLNPANVKNRVGALMRSIARIELPNQPRIPYGGTGFVVGPDLMMTNRHVAKLFTEGLGLNIRYNQGDAEVDFNRRVDTPDNDRSARLKVAKVEMIHPFWDMALIRVAGLSDHFPMLPLSILKPEELVDRDVLVIGYPARDDRSDLALQDRIFARTYNVKRLQPGKIRPRMSVKSFETVVSAMTHDSSTLGGNSGSAIIDLKTGQVVGLHFAGEYLKANYAVPTFELARDARVTKLKLNFSGTTPEATKDFDVAWARTGAKNETPDAVVTPQQPAPDVQSSLQTPVTVVSATSQWTIPIHVSITVGQPSAPGASESAVAMTEAPRMQLPIIFSGLENRKGYQPGFLDLDDDEEVPLPELTSTGNKAAAKLDDGSTELKYHKFSLVMHKGRRLALFTAANVDWRSSVRLIDGRKPSRGELSGIPDGTAELWQTDWRIDANHQLPDVFFTKDGGMFDKGHLVRRDDVCWGKTFKDIQKANGDTYHTTNCSPQTAAFNQGAKGEDNWGDLESLVQQQTKAEKAILFSGPVLDEDDPVFEGKGENGAKLMVRIPRRFWKIVVVKGATTPDAYGFVLEQDLSALEFAVPTPWKRYMKSIEEIEEMLQGLVDLSWLKRFDRAETEEGVRMAEGVRVG
jgi:endonuclease G